MRDYHAELAHFLLFAQKWPGLSWFFDHDNIVFCSIFEIGTVKCFMRLHRNTRRVGFYALE